MKEMLHQRMFETGSYKSLPEHIALYEALEASMDRAQRDDFLAKKDKSRKRRRDDQDPPPPPPDSDQSKRRRHDTGASGSSQPQAPQSSALKKSDTRDAPSRSSKPEWLKHIPDDERRATPELAWVILTSYIPDAVNNWANALATTYQAPAENFLLEKTGDMWTFMNWYFQKMGKFELTQADLEDQIDWANPEGDQVRIDISKPLSLSGPPSHVTIQTQFFFNKDLDYLCYGSKGSRQALTISKMKAARYHDFRLELLIPEHMLIDDICTYDISASYGISYCVVRIKSYSRYGYDYLKEITLGRADHQENMIAKKDFKNLYPSDFEDLNLLLLQGYLNHLPGSDIRMLSTAVKLWTQNLVIRQRVEDFQLGIESYQKQLNLTKPGWDATGFEFKHDYIIIDSPHAVVFPITLDYRVKEYKVNRLNPGVNTRFWTDKDVERSKEFIHSIERRHKTRRIFQNLECFVGGRVRDIDYRLF
ncbi:hypothetical protein Tco_1436593 [Tanacetum coccineum]